MKPSFLNLINGVRMPAKDGTLFESRNPAHTDELIGTFPRSKAEDVDAAVAAAAEAFPVWSAVSLPDRGNALFRIAELIEERRQLLVDVIVREMGKTTIEADGEVTGARDMARFQAGEGRRLFGAVLPSRLNRRHAEVRRVPMGVCALLTPWNSPLAAIAWKVFPAIICGNTCVLKPSEYTPAIADALMSIIHEAGVPPGVVNVVYGFGQEVGAALVAHPRIDLVSFTGSTDVGRKIAAQCAVRNLKLELELSGKNGILVMPDADLDQAALGVLSGAFSWAGQRCSTTARVIIHEQVHDALVQRLVQGVSQWVVGPGSHPTTKVCPLVSREARDRVLEQIAAARDDGATLAHGGVALTDGEYAKGWYVQPTIFTHVKPDSRLAQEEVFGPVLSVIVCRDFDEGMGLMNGTAYGLTASIYTSDLATAMRFTDEVKAGVCYVNGPTFGSEVNMPFGGVGASGNGSREAGGGIDTYSQPKGVYIDYSGSLQNSQTGKR